MALSDRKEGFSSIGGFLGRRPPHLLQTPGTEIKNNPEISYEHAKIILTEYGYMLKDLNSSNGTYLRIKNSNSIPLENDTIFEMGQSRFQVKKITIKETKNKKKIVIIPIDGKAKNGDKTQIKLDFNEITKYKLGNSSTEKPEYVNIKDETLEKYHINICYEDKNIYLKNNNKKDE